MGKRRKLLERAERGCTCKLAAGTSSGDADDTASMIAQWCRLTTDQPIT